MNVDLVSDNFADREKIAKKRYMEFIMQKLDKKEHKLDALTAGTILGSEEFVTWIKENAEQKGWINVKSNAKKKLFTTEELQTRIIEIINAEKGMFEKNKRKLIIYLLKNYTEMSLKEISATFPELTKAGVFKVSKRFEEQLLKDKQLNRKNKNETKSVKCQLSNTDTHIFIRDSDQILHSISCHRFRYGLKME